MTVLFWTKQAQLRPCLSSPCDAGVIFIPKSSGGLSYTVILGDAEKKKHPDFYEVIKLVVGSESSR